MATAATLPRSVPARSGPEPRAGAALAAIALVGSIFLLLHGDFLVSRPRHGQLDAVGAVLVALSTLPVLAWRRSPLGVFALTATANVLLAAIVYPIGVPLGPAAALYLLAASRDEASPWIGRITGSALALLSSYVIAAALAEGTFPGFEVLHAGLLWSVAWFAGERTRLRREQIAELQLDAQRERLLATAEERARIARDLHDSVGHAINVIAVRAGAARLRHRDEPARSLVALEAIEDLARRTVAEIDHLVGALRDRNAPDAVEPPPGLASLPTLVAQHVGAGLDVDYATTGSSRHLGSAVDQAAYRILQEALTNASRHGPGSAHVNVTFGDTALELRVTNPVVVQRPRQLMEVGHGLVGMLERTDLLGGDLNVERGRDIFCVSARLPYGINLP